MMTPRLLACWTLATGLTCGVGCGHFRAKPASTTSALPARTIASQELELLQAWQIEPPDGEPLNASGLALFNGELYMVHDRALRVYRLLLGEGPTARLELQNWFKDTQLPARADCEGIAFDDSGHVYVCEESTRQVYRHHLGNGKTVALPIDWSPAADSFSADPNASFEGIAAAPRRLYLCNERSNARIVVVDTSTWRVVNDFFAAPKPPFLIVHYSDLSWSDNFLFILLRHQRAILKLDPANNQVLAQYDYSKIEKEPALAYRTQYPTGVMEGLAVEGSTVWLVTDNNGLPRKNSPADTRPTLLKCRIE